MKPTVQMSRFLHIINDLGELCMSFAPGRRPITLLLTPTSRSVLLYVNTGKALRVLSLIPLEITHSILVPLNQFEKLCRIGRLPQGPILPFFTGHRCAMPTDQNVKSLKQKINQYKKACLSDWPQPSDYTKLIDAQYALRALTADKAAG